MPSTDLRARRCAEAIEKPMSIYKRARPPRAASLPLILRRVGRRRWQLYREGYRKSCGTGSAAMQPPWFARRFAATD